jgi:hypothetical protein
MATRTWRGTTNANWGTATNWLEGAVPLVVDDIVFDATSPACTVNVVGVGLTINFTSYTNTIGKVSNSIIWGNKGDNVKITVSLIVPVALEEKQRFAIREGGRTVGAGVVAKIIQ